MLKKEKKILCLGSINMDLVMSMDHLPGLGETVVTDNFKTYPGGKGGNQAVTASRLGGNVQFLGKLGDDNYSDQLIEELKNQNVNTDNIIRKKNSNAGIAMIRVDKNGENSISFTPGANKDISISDLKENEDLFFQSEILLITMEINNNVVYEAIRIAKRNNMFIILDPAPAPKLIPEDIPEMIDIITPNESEAEILTGINIKTKEDAIKAIKKFKKMGINFPIITWGEKGCVINIEDEFKVIEPLKNIEVVDSTAAGDVFVGALAAFISKDKPMEKSIKFANNAASLSTTIKGAQTSIPSLNKLEEFID